MTVSEDGVPQRLRKFLERHPIDVEILELGVPMPTVPMAAAAIGVAVDKILKTILFVGDSGGYVVAIACGTQRISWEALARVSGLSRPRPAHPDMVPDVTGYPAGGVAPIGLKGNPPVVVDTRVAALRIAYGGAGREDQLLRIDPADIIRLNSAIVADIVEPPRTG